MLLDILLLESAVSLALVVLVVCAGLLTPTPRGALFAPAALVALHGVAAALTFAFTGALPSAAIGVVGAIAAAWALTILLKPYSPGVRLLMAAQAQMTLVGLAWGVTYVVGLDVSTTTKVLMLSAAPLMLVTVPLGVLGMMPQWDVLGRQHWRRPRAAVPGAARESYPKVSLHVPICSEPPGVVLETLEKLRALDYPNFEVLVIDNNTKDEALWRPVERWCARHRHFRFFHLEHCPGAKAGALNFALKHTAYDAALIGLIDADYHAKPNFLSELVGHFDDGRVGFVQTPHDYRDWAHSLYQRMCYWEYRSFFTVSLPTWNEHGAAITVGTMALIRRAALEKAGGWSEWCLTEDSELAPRIHACGYSSVYVQQTFGRGLIPETFGGYAKQRRRWTYGPIQELRHHIPMLLPKRLGGRGALTRAQKLFHLHHDLEPFFSGLGLLLLPIAGATIASMLLHGEQPRVPMIAIAAGVIAGLAGQVMSWTVQRRAMRCSFGDIFYAGIAKAALSYCIAASALRAIAGVPLAWQRTNKFKARSEGVRRALSDTRVEACLGVALITLGVHGLLAGPRGLLLFLLVGLTLQGVGFLFAPAFALLAEWELRRERAAEELAGEVEAVAS